MAHYDVDAGEHPTRMDGKTVMKEYWYFAMMHELAEFLAQRPELANAVRTGVVDVFFGTVNAPGTPEDECVAEVVCNLFFTYRGHTVGPFPFGEDKENGMTRTALNSFVGLLLDLLSKDRP